ncbi:MAG TPA: MFS transporter, partial [Thermomicrobiaceae bacterium]|nr:MFS transporter [Thermomicrobiaceae bacterium]
SALSAWVAGALSDRIGRVPVLRITVVLGTVGVAGVAFSPWLWLVGIFGACVASAFGGFQSVNWAQMADVMPKGRSAEFYGLSNIATAGSGAVAGLFGPLADFLNALLPGGTYIITFGLAALIALSSLIPLRRLK